MALSRICKLILAASAFVMSLTAQTWAATATIVTVDMTNQQDGSQVMRLDRAEVPDAERAEIGAAVAGRFGSNVADYVRRRFIMRKPN